MKHIPQLLLATLAGAMFHEADTGANTTATDKPAEVKVPEGMRAETFHFRREKVTDEAGAEVGEVKKHPSVMIPLPIPTKDEVLTIMQAPSEGEGNRAAEQKFLLDLISDAYYGQAREQINDFRANNKDATVSANVVDYSKLNILALATMPASERGGAKISDEDIKAFLADYAAIMPAALQKDANKIKAQVGLLDKGLRSVKTDKKVLEVMDNVLTVWATATANLEEHQTVYDMFKNRIQKWIKQEPQNVLEAIF
jgi:hypothetical protein